MNPIIRYKLWKISRRAVPDASFVARLGTRFANRKPQDVKSGFTVYGLRFAEVAVMVLVLLGGTTGYAYASDDVIPTHPLYPMREGVESVEETVAFTADAKAAVQRKHANRRLREIRTMRARRQAIAPAVVNRLRHTMERIEATSTAEGVRTVDAWNGILQNRVRALNQTEGDRLDREADEQLDRIEEHLKRLEDKARQMRPGALRRK